MGLRERLNSSGALHSWGVARQAEMLIQQINPLRTAPAGSRIQTARAVLTALFVCQPLLPAAQFPGATETDPAPIANTRGAPLLPRPLGASTHTLPSARIARTARPLVRNGAIYLSLNDALALA